ncbi:MAG: sugar transferase [Clostridiales bacterium]|nr:sugar transferase [Clostridiales bacterium]
MKLRNWDELPESLRTEETLRYYNILKNKKCALFFKRIFDIVVSFVMLLILLPVFAVLAIAIKLDSKGPVFYRQIRVTQYGTTFRIFKFRTMVHNADKIGNLVTMSNDSRITRVGRFIRKYRLDEICQIIDVLRGTMTFVGERGIIETTKNNADFSRVVTVNSISL